MFALIIDVLDVIASHENHSSDIVSMQSALDALQTFEFAFLLHLMKLVLDITNALSQNLQGSGQDIINAISLITTAKKQLQMTRDQGWDILLNIASSFCVKHDIEIPNMDDFYIVRGNSKSRVSKITNEHHHRIDVFYTIFDMQIQELNSHLNSSDSFPNFDKKKILRMAKLYPNNFDDLAIEALACELDTFMANVHDDVRLSNMMGLGELSRKLVQTKKHLHFPNIHLLLKLALISSKTATVESVFSVMKFIKTKLRNKISDEFSNDTIVTYFEIDLFKSLSNNDIMLHLQNMRPC